MFPKYKNKKNLYSNLNNDDSDDDNILSTIGAFSIGADSDSDEDGGEALRSMPHLPKPSASTFSTGDAPISLKKRAANLYTTLTFDWLKPLLDMGNDKVRSTRSEGRLERSDSQNYNTNRSPRRFAPCPIAGST